MRGTDYSCVMENVSRDRKVKVETSLVQLRRQCLDAVPRLHDHPMSPDMKKDVMPVLLSPVSPVRI